MKDTRHDKAELLVKSLLDDKPTTTTEVPIDDVVEWAPVVFCDTFAQYEPSGKSKVPDFPEDVLSVLDSGEGYDDPSVAASLSAWFNKNWQEICNVNLDGDGGAPQSWRGMVWTPELAARVLGNI